MLKGKDEDLGSRIAPTDSQQGSGGHYSRAGQRAVGICVGARHEQAGEGGQVQRLGSFYTRKVTRWFIGLARASGGHLQTPGHSTLPACQERRGHSTKKNGQCRGVPAGHVFAPTSPPKSRQQVQVRGDRQRDADTWG